MILELQKKLTYGPIRSRRLGVPLGINLFPGNIKWCPSDCVYCHFGWTVKMAFRLRRGHVPLPSPSEVEEAVRRALDGLPMLPVYLTFSGNREPISLLGTRGRYLRGFWQTIARLLFRSAALASRAVWLKLNVNGHR